MEERVEQNLTRADGLGIAGRETAKSIPFKNAARLQGSFTAEAERKALVWLAARLPAWVNSDHLTLAGFVAMFLAGASYAFARTIARGFCWRHCSWR